MVTLIKINDGMMVKTWIGNRGNFPEDLPIDTSLYLQRLDLIRLFSRLNFDKPT